MGWKEQVEGWTLDIQGQTSDGYKIGTGERLFIESPSAVCNTALPDIGDEMYDPYATTTYANIFCTNINYKRTHSSGANGKTAVVSYASPELASSSGAQRQTDNEAGTFSADLVALNVQGGTTWFWYTNNAADGATTVFPIAPIPAGHLGGPCAENLPLTVMQIQRTKRIQFDDDADLEAWMPKVQTYGGKVNSEAMLGFAKGQVLLGGISGSMNNGKWDIDIVFICRKVTDAAVTQDDWNYMPSASEGGVTYHRPMKANPVFSPGGPYVQANGQGWMYGYADIAQILDTDPPVEP